MQNKTGIGLQKQNLRRKAFVLSQKSSNRFDKIYELWRKGANHFSYTKYDLTA
jgi:hypothetical protein